MTGALGVRPALLFTSVFALGSALAGLGGALQLPREPASLALDLATVTDAFVVVVIGGLGSVPGAFVAALLVAQVKAICIGLGTVEWGPWSFSFSKLTLVAEFLVMAGVLLVRPWGLWGRAPTPASNATEIQRGPREMSPRWTWALLCCVVLLALWPWFLDGFPYARILGVDMGVAVLFAASLHFIMGPAGLHSFGHAAYFGVGAYAAAWMLLGLGWPMEVSLVLAPLVCLVLALLLGWFSLRLAGIYLAMLTLACSQIIWAVAFQWDDVTGGSNGLNGVWPNAWLTDKRSYYTLTLLLAFGAVAALRRLYFSPFGFALRAARDSTPRAQAIGIHTRQVQWLAFGVAGLVAGLAGVVSVFSKGSVSPDALGVSRSVDGLVTVLLGGVQSLAAPVLGAITLTWLQDTVMRNTEYWRALLGALMLGIVLLAPGGLAGAAHKVAHAMSRWRRRGQP
jgi:branched-chain amino acid transport system permease protein